jgi:hypothetical protein
LLIPPDWIQRTKPKNTGRYAIALRHSRDSRLPIRILFSVRTSGQRTVHRRQDQLRGSAR